MEYLSRIDLQEFVRRCGAVIEFAGVGAAAPANVHHVRQVHAVDIVDASSVRTPWGGAEDRPVADGLLTTAVGQVLAIKTADCMPVFVIAPTAPRIIVAVHAGWRGLAKGMLQAALAELGRCAQANGNAEVNRGTLRVVIGPCISGKRYEVGEDVYLAMRQGPTGLSSAEASECFAQNASHPGHYHFDLRSAAALVLVRLGIVPGHIAALSGCTFADEDQWYSYRRAGGELNGNQNWSCLSLMY